MKKRGVLLNYALHEARKDLPPSTQRLCCALNMRLCQRERELCGLGLCLVGHVQGWMPLTISIRCQEHAHCLCLIGKVSLQVGMGYMRWTRSIASNSKSKPTSHGRCASNWWSVVSWRVRDFTSFLESHLPFLERSQKLFPELAYDSARAFALLHLFAYSSMFLHIQSVVQPACL